MRGSDIPSPLDFAQRVRSGYPSPVGPSLTQVRSTLSQPYGARADNWPDSSPLVVELAIAPKAGEHWVLDNVIMSGVITVAAPPAGQLLSPTSGLFMVERNRQPIENLAQAQVGNGWDPRARGIPLPVISSLVPLANGGWAYVIFYNGMIGRTVPEDWTIRGILNCNPGTAVPGPGAGSSAELVAVFERELNYGASS
jgi:hypothetical protein